MQRGAKVLSGEREIGLVTSATISPALGPIALGYVHRDFIGAGAGGAAWTAIAAHASSALADVPRRLKRRGSSEQLDQLLVGWRKAERRQLRPRAPSASPARAAAAALPAGHTGRRRARPCVPDRRAWSRRAVVRRRHPTSSSSRISRCSASACVSTDRSCRQETPTGRRDARRPGAG